MRIRGGCPAKEAGCGGGGGGAVEAMGFDAFERKHTKLNCKLLYYWLADLVVQERNIYTVLM